MHSESSSTLRSTHWLLAGVLAILLVVLATLQYRWLGEVSEAEQARLRSAMDQEAFRVADQFDGLVSTLLWELSQNSRALADDVAATLAVWRTESPYPALIDNVLRITATVDTRRARSRRDAAPVPAPQPRIRLERLNPQTEEFEQIDWTPELRPLMRSLAPQRRGGERLALGELEPTIPALTVNVSRQRQRRPGGRAVTEPEASSRVVLAMMLSESVLQELAREEVLGVIAGSLGSNFDYRLLNIQGEIVAASSASSEPDWDDNTDVQRYPLFRLRPTEEARRAASERFRQVARRTALARGTTPRDGPPWLRNDGSNDQFSLRPGLWTLEIAHRDGTLEAAVAKTRTRNLMLSGAILGLLGLAVLILLRTAAKDRQLAEQQVDFIAGLTHELHTPLAAISSAGANLADGVVSDQRRVQEYGEMLKAEGARLGELVGQALDLAGVESPLSELGTQTISMPTLVQEAIDRTQLIANEASATVTATLSGEGQAVSGDREALLRALTNLLGNAVKYGGSNIRIELDEVGDRVRIAVSDDGPGVAKRDIPRLFEPFTRGADASLGGKSGAGLGLHLARRIVERHHGDLRYVAEQGPGATFQVTLPSANAGAEAKSGIAGDHEFQEPT